jgi:hypothetical protein
MNQGFFRESGARHLFSPKGRSFRTAHPKFLLPQIAIQQVQGETSTALHPYQAHRGECAKCWQFKIDVEQVFTSASATNGDPFTRSMLAVPGTENLRLEISYFS